MQFESSIQPFHTAKNYIKTVGQQVGFLGLWTSVMDGGCCSFFLFSLRVMGRVPAPRVSTWGELTGWLTWGFKIRLMNGSWVTELFKSFFCDTEVMELCNTRLTTCRWNALKCFLLFFWGRSQVLPQSSWWKGPWFWKSPCNNRTPGLSRFPIFWETVFKKPPPPPHATSFSNSLKYLGFL